MKTRKISRSTMLGILVAVVLILSACAQPTPATTAVPPVSTAAPQPATAVPPTAAQPAATKPNTVAPTAAAIKSLTIGMDGDLSILDPANIDQAPDHLVAQNIYCGLLKYKPNSLDIMPYLAERWEVSPDGKMYTFHLRKNVQWSGGYGPVTASDVKFSLNRIVDPATKSRFAPDLVYLDRVDVVDDYTARVVLKNPYPPLLASVMAFRPGWLISEKAMAKLGKDYFSKPVGCGPFIFDQWLQGAEVVLKANPDFFLGAPVVKEVHLKIIKGTGPVLALALGAGELDITQVRDSEILKAIQGVPNVEIESIPSTFSSLAFINMKRSPFDNLKVRQALQYAVNRSDLVDQVMKGVGRKSVSILPPQMLGYTTNVTVLDYDANKAKSLLKEAGVADGTPLVILTRDTSYYPVLATVLQQSWSQVGFKVEVAQLDAGTYSVRRGKLDYDILLLSPGRFESDQMLTPYFYSTSLPPSGSNFAVYGGSDKEIDAQRTEVDQQKRATIISQITKKISDDVPAIPLFIPDSVVAHRKGLQGIVPDLYVGGLELFNIH